ncbi:alpha/beta fold hydrolase [Synechococcales cyanobacterium C]|uniref:Alpha/beta fold hydrolase n=1 Tax=Petrachloros mirabilis ULC683 TaxID=2781853 RepID=A0A8K1ZW06_9CYAN|nr:alpha/beta fold hydrolase [Petrachloros mirabilis]NCJ05142.1 alpha/beta fold hydrolase [Petrachloros mirabilis ULC683]
MSTFVLIHGAGSGAWVWHKVVPLLKQQGHLVITPDLPGHGQNLCSLAEVTLSAYVDCVGQALKEQSEPVILVGHSMGGGIITQVAEYYPDRIQTLVYLAGYLLRSGETMLEITQADAESILLANAIFTEDQLAATFRPEALKEIGYGDCSDEDMALVRSRLIPQAVAPLVTPVSTTTGNFGRVPRVYIECLRDRTIGPTAQKRMYTALLCEQVISMDTSHNPYLSCPQALAGHLLALQNSKSVNGESGAQR